MLDKFVKGTMVRGVARGVVPCAFAPSAGPNNETVMKVTLIPANTGS